MIILLSFIKFCDRHIPFLFYKKFNFGELFKFGTQITQNLKPLIWPISA